MAFNKELQLANWLIQDVIEKRRSQYVLSNNQLTITKGNQTIALAAFGGSTTYTREVYSR